MCRHSRIKLNDNFNQQEIVCTGTMTVYIIYMQMFCFVFFKCKCYNPILMPPCQIPAVQLPSSVSFSGCVQQLYLPQCHLHAQLPEAVVDSVLGSIAGKKGHKKYLQIEILTSSWVTGLHYSSKSGWQPIL